VKRWKGLMTSSAQYPVGCGSPPVVGMLVALDTIIRIRGMKPPIS
jgi:hypothetical protein